MVFQYCYLSLPTRTLIINSLKPRFGLNVSCYRFGVSFHSSVQAWYSHIGHMLRNAEGMQGFLCHGEVMQTSVRRDIIYVSADEWIYYPLLLWYYHGSNEFKVVQKKWTSYSLHWKTTAKHHLSSDVTNSIFWAK